MDRDILRTNAMAIINNIKARNNLDNLISMYFTYLPEDYKERNIFHEMLLNTAATELGKQSDLNLLFDLFDEVKLDPSDLIPSKELWRYCLNLDNYLLLEKLLNRGYYLLSEGNIVRQAVYANKLNIAKLLLSKGYAAPESLTLFAISNQLGWDPIRVQFLLDNGAVFTVDEKEQTTLNILKNNPGWNISKIKK